MRTSRLIAAVLAAGALSIQTGRAADASHPYSNVNHAVDAGNNTGDSQVDQLNQQQLDKTKSQTQHGTWQGQARGYGNQGYGGSAYRTGPGYPPAYAYASPYPYGYPYPGPYYARAYYRPFFGWGWGWGWRHRFWGGPRFGVFIR